MDIYAENVMDHYRNPRNYGKLDSPTKSRHEVNQLCGDAVDLDVVIEEGVLKKAAFKGEGCAISQAGVSILLEEVEGMSLDEILELGREDVVEMLGVEITARRKKCAVLSLLALQNAILEYKGEEVKTFADLLLE